MNAWIRLVGLGMLGLALSACSPSIEVATDCRSDAKGGGTGGAGGASTLDGAGAGGPGDGSGSGSAGCKNTVKSGLTGASQ